MVFKSISTRLLLLIVMPLCITSCATINGLMANNEESSSEIKEISLNKRLQISIPIPENSKYVTDKTIIFGENVKADFTGKKQTLKKATAKGNVVIENVKKGQRSKADLGVYNSSDEIIKLTGNVVIINKKSTIRGSRGITNLKSGISNIIGNRKKGQRVKGVFSPTKNKVKGD